MVPESAASFEYEVQNYMKQLQPDITQEMLDSAHDLTIIIPQQLPKFLFLTTSRNFDYPQALSYAQLTNIDTHIALRHSASAALIASVLAIQYKKRAVSLALESQPLNPDLAKLLSVGASYLQSLTLVQCGLNTDRIKQISKAISSFDSLIYVDFSRNPLTDTGAILILENLKAHRELRFIGLAATQSRDSTVRALVENYSNSQIAYVDLSENAGIGRESAQLLISLVQNSNQILQINLINCAIQNRQLQEIQKFLKRNVITQELFDELVDTVLDRLNLRGLQQLADSVKIADSSSFEQKIKTLQVHDSEVMRILENAKYEGKSIFREQFLPQLCICLSKNKPRKMSHAPKNVQIASAETMGRRQEMEDVVYSNMNFHQFRTRRGKQQSRGQKEILLCLFDGHGGRDCSEALAAQFPLILADALNCIQALITNELSQLSEQFWQPFMETVFVALDEVLKERKLQAGSTAAVVLILNGFVIQANCGDSRVVLCRDTFVARQNQIDWANFKIKKGRADDPLKQQNKEECAEFSQIPSDNVQQVLEQSIRLSKDHKPNLPDEVLRIEKMGGYVQDGRLQGLLAVARSFGDFLYKPFLTAAPYVSTYQLNQRDFAIIIACDGVWDVICDIDASILALQCTTSQACAIKLRDESYKLESQDNISVIICRLQ
ncbi:Protein phosphatase 2C [Spironucleus salmonicida]|nr:Protein phosphatase 2C [Spironucleus salmonicida]